MVSSPIGQITEQGANMRSSTIWNKFGGAKRCWDDC